MNANKPLRAHPGSTAGAATKRKGRRVLVDGNLKLVYKIAVSVYRSIHGAIELDDLVGFGTEGLLQAAQRFDPGRDCAFTTYAYPRIHGAIYDGIRQLAPLPSSIYRRAFGDRRPAGEGAPEETELEFARLTPFVTSLEAHVARGHQLTAVQDSAEQTAIAGELRDFMAGAVGRLSARERDLILAHYYQDDTLQGAGRKLGISRSWASRLHNRAIDHLRDSLRDSMAAVGLAA